jgi:hypothetical protein
MMMRMGVWAKEYGGHAQTDSEKKIQSSNDDKRGSS